MDYPALAEYLSRASLLSQAGGVPALASAQTGAHTSPCHRRTCPPLRVVPKKGALRSVDKGQVSELHLRRLLRPPDEFVNKTLIKKTLNFIWSEKKL